ncbi:sigma-54-dependent transcriptional regulator [Marinomonas epiphytica]
MHHIIVICPESSDLHSADNWLSKYGFHVNTCVSFKQAEKYYELSEFHLALVDQTSIQELDDEQSTLNSLPPRIVLDARPSLNSGIDSMAAGAKYYLPLPTDSETLLRHIIDALDESETDKTEPAPKAEVSQEDNIQLGSAQSGIIGQCAPMQELYSDIQKVAGTDVTVLIRGESGTGKELVAKALHNLSHRKKHSLISVNCAAIPENLIESELFGHEKGAFTGAVSARDGLIFAADKGTLFLDEIGELPLEAQARLLRVLQEGEIRRVGAIQSTKVDIRLVTATHRNLYKMVEEGQFREDLYYRLYVMELLLPPLRDRGDDIVLIAKALLEKACLKHRRPLYKFNKEFDQAIRSHHWPGNVRELENAIERAVILSPEHKIEAKNLKLASQTKHSQTTKMPPPAESAMAGTTLNDYFCHFVLSHQHKMTETELAHSLGISRKSLWERRQKLDLNKR